MSNHTAQLVTADQLAAMPDDGKRYELVGGVLRMMSPAGGRHGRGASRMHARLIRYLDENDLGETFIAETGFLIARDPDTVRVPDVAYASYERLGEYGDHPGYLPLAPELVVEVVSPTDRSSAVEAKAIQWVKAGVMIVLVIDPQNKTIREYRSGDVIRSLSEGSLDLGDVLPGFQLDVAELFV